MQQQYDPLNHTKPHETLARFVILRVISWIASLRSQQSSAVCSQLHRPRKGTKSTNETPHDSCAFCAFLRLKFSTSLAKPLPVLNRRNKSLHHISSDKIAIEV